MTKPKKHVRIRTNEQRAQDRARGLVSRASRAQAPRSELVEYTTLPIAEIETGEYQRALNPGWVEALVRDFNPALFEPLHIALRDDNKYYVVDGQHRLEVARARGMQTVPVVLHLDTVEKDEAKLFVALQDRKLGLNQIARHHANVVAGDNMARHLDQILHANNFSISEYQGGADRALACPLTLEYVLQTYGEGILSTTLQIISAAWGGKKDSLKAMIIKGVALYLSEHTDIISTPIQGKLVERLHALKPADMMLRAAVIRHTMGCTPFRAFAQGVSDVANQGRGIYPREKS